MAEMENSIRNQTSMTDDEPALRCPPTRVISGAQTKQGRRDKRHKFRLRVNDGWVTPNLWDWRAADVILYSSDAKAFGSAQSAVVRAFQAGEVCDAAHARWTHVGIFDGASAVWEANPGRNVSRRKITDVIAGRRLLQLRRLRGLSITNRQLYDAVRLHAEAKYDLLPIVVERIGKLREPEDPRRAACSVFVNRVLVHLASRRLFKDVVHPTHAMFAASDLFENVPTQWCAL